MRRPARSDIALGLLVCVIALAAAIASVNGSNSLEDRAQRLESSLRCPTCAGASIADSPAAIAAQMRAVVVERLGAGDSDQDVRDYFVARYGRWILLDPPLGGVDTALWVLPAVVIAAGSALVVARARQPGAAAAGARPGRRSGRRLVSVAATGFIAAALAVPVVMALTPRRAGSEITGRAAANPTTDVATARSRVAAAPNDPGALIDLGDALLAADMGSDAAEQYRAALAIDPKDVRALLGVAAILLDADRPDAAVNALERVLKQAPDQPDALVMRGLARFRIDGSVTARVRADLSRFLTIAPADARAPMVVSLLAPSASPS
jgi:cytochrome c-type biogenesis protein CcmH